LRSLAVTDDVIGLAGGGSGFHVLESQIRPQAAILPEDERLYFGPVPRGESRPLVLWIINEGTSQLSGEITLPGSVENEFHFSTRTFNIPPRDSLRISVVFEPEIQYGIGLSYSTTATLVSNDPARPNIPLTIQWKGGRPPNENPLIQDDFTVGLWHFNEATGTVASDTSGHDLHGQLRNGPVHVASKDGFGQGLAFDGNDDWVEIPADPLLNITDSPLTAELWFSMDTPPSQNGYYILMRRDNQYELAIGMNEGVIGSVWEDSSGTLVKRSISTGSIGEINSNQWYHVALTWDTDSLRLYLNGVLRDQRDFRLTLPNRPAYVLAIGASSGLNVPFDGKIDEVRISSAARQIWEFHVNMSQLALRDEAVYFGNVLLDQLRRVPLVIENRGTQTLSITSLTSSVPDVTISGSTERNIGSGQQETIWLNYAPTVAGPLDDQSVLTIQSTDPTYPRIYVPLRGAGVTTLPAGAYETDPFTLGLYHTDELQGSPVYDYSGYDMHGAWNGATRTLGRFGRALLFDGQDDRLVITPDSSHWIGPRWGGLTAETWFRIESALPQDRSVLMRRGEGSLSQFDLSLNEAIIEGRFYNTTGDSFVVTSASMNTALEVNKWYHVALSADDDTLRLFMNGDVVDVDTLSGTLAGSMTETAYDTVSLLIGRDQAGDYPFGGHIDEVRISGIGRKAWEYNVNMARVRVSSRHLDFGNVLAEKNRNMKLWISNPGIDSLIVSGITTSNTLFSVDTTNFTVLPGHQQRVNVQFAPLGQGFQSAQLNVISNDPFTFEPVLLEGEGILTRHLGEYVPDALTQSLYHFNVMTDTTTSDSIPPYRRAALHGGSGPSNQGRFDDALILDGDDGWVEIPTDSSFNPGGSDLTADFWFLMTEKPAVSTVLFRRESETARQMEINLHPTYGLRGLVWDSQGEGYTLVSGSMDTLNTDQWYHAALSWDGDSLRLYLNGTVRDVQRLVQSLRPADNEPVVIGVDGALGTFFNGQIDELRFSSVARLDWEYNVSPPGIALYPERLEFPTVLAGQARVLAFGVSNMGDQDLVVANMTGLNNPFSFPQNLSTFVVPRLETQIVPVTYRPTQGNTVHRDTLTITSNDIDHSPMSIILGGSSSSSTKRAAYTTDSHTQALFHFDEGEGTSTADSSDGTGGVALLHGALWVQGYFGGGIRFDGVNDWVEISNDSTLQFDMQRQSFSIECFFRTDTTSQAILVKGFLDQPDYGILINDRGLIEIPGFGSSGTIVSDGGWHHVAFTYDHTTTLGTGTLYIDGVLSWSRDWNQQTQSSSDRPIILGAVELAEGQRARYFEGDIDELRISGIVRYAWEFPFVDYAINVASFDPNPPVLDSPLTITVDVPQSLSAAAVRFYYRKGGGTTYTSQTGQQLNDTTYQIVLTATEMNLYGLEYYISVVTTGGDTLTQPYMDAANRPASAIVRHSGLPGQLDYYTQQREGGTYDFQLLSLFSIPFQLDSTDVPSVLQDDLGNYDPFRWRLYWWHRIRDEYVEYRTRTQRDIFDLSPGRAFWLVLDTERQLDVPTGQTISTASHYPVEIGGGWNMIGSPYTFPVQWDDCFATTDSLSTLYYFDGDNGFRLDWPTMEPWKGYFVYLADSSAASDTLYVLPRAAQTVDGIGKRSRVPRGVLSNLSEDEWILRFSVDAKTAKDLDNYAGIRNGAKSGWDYRDRPEPPAFIDGVTFSFDHTDWPRHAGRYAADIRSSGEDGYVWKATLAAPQEGQSVTVTWSFNGVLPKGWMAYLFDAHEGVAKNLLSDQHMTFTSRDPAIQGRNLKVVVGPQAYIESHSDGIPLTPVSFALHQNYPNPFNPETTVHYSLPKREHVKVTIFNALGQQVSVLIQEVQQAGHHRVRWNGRDSLGRLAPSGVYLIRLETASQVGSRKMVLIK